MAWFDSPLPLAMAHLLSDTLSLPHLTPGAVLRFFLADISCVGFNFSLKVFFVEGMLEFG